MKLATAAYMFLTNHTNDGVETNTYTCPSPFYHIQYSGELFYFRIKQGFTLI